MTAFILTVFSAMFIKLTSSFDDILWLPKPVENRPVFRRVIIYSVYLAVLLGITAAAFLISLAGTSALAAAGNGKIFTIGAALGLIGYAVFFLRKSNDSDQDYHSSGTLADDIKQTSIISGLGSVDELFSYMVLFSTGTVGVVPMGIGTVIAGVLVIFIVEIMRILHRKTGFSINIPMWIIIVGIGIWSLFQAFGVF